LSRGWPNGPDPAIHRMSAAGDSPKAVSFR